MKWLWLKCGCGGSETLLTSGVFILTNFNFYFLCSFFIHPIPSGSGCGSLFYSFDVTHTIASLEVLSEDVITEQLQKRFESNQIYTYIGDILVGVNPFVNLGLYTRQHQKRYVGKSRFENPPHIFAVADAAHQVSDTHTHIYIYHLFSAFSTHFIVSHLSISLWRWWCAL